MTSWIPREVFVSLSTLLTLVGSAQALFILLGLTFLTLLTPNAEAQPSPWFPLPNGASWRYETPNGATRTRTVLGDTAVDGRAAVRVREVDEDASGAVVLDREFAVRFDERRLRWVAAAGPVPASFAPCPLVNPDDDEVVECVDEAGEPDERRVDESEEPVPLPTGGEAVVRTYASQTQLSVLALAEGVGPVAFTEGTEVYALVARTAVASGPAPEVPVGVAVWPSPASGPVTLRYVSGGAGPLTVEVLDVRGRLVRSVRVPAAPEGRSIALGPPDAAGVYAVRVVGPDGVVGLTRVVWVR